MAGLKQGTATGTKLDHYGIGRLTAAVFFVAFVAAEAAPTALGHASPNLCGSDFSRDFTKRYQAIFDDRKRSQRPNMGSSRSYLSAAPVRDCQ